jgi:septal ring factor EnvC (AmiA/AmiB activator)
VRGSRRTRGFVLFAQLALALPVATAFAARDDAGADPVLRARAREALMATRATTTTAEARAQALAAYRLARRRSAEFVSDARRRAEIARALDSAVLVLRRTAGESAAWRREHALAERERGRLEAGAAGPGRLALANAGEREGLTHPGVMLADVDARARRAPLAPLLPLALPWPVRGHVLGAPGLRRDGGTGTEVVSEGLEILSRMNEPVRAIEDGLVRKAVPLPQGRYAVLTEHAEGRLVIVSGLRQLDVAEGTLVARGQRLGLVGRDLDGAPVVTVEIWEAGAPIDPRLVLAPETRQLRRR